MQRVIFSLVCWFSHFCNNTGFSLFFSFKSFHASRNLSNGALLHETYIYLFFNEWNKWLFYEMYLKTNARHQIFSTCGFVLRFHLLDVLLSLCKAAIFSRRWEIWAKCFKSAAVSSNWKLPVTRLWHPVRQISISTLLLKLNDKICSSIVFQFALISFPLIISLQMSE